MKIVIFDVKGKIAHFRRPDTTATHLTYPFITPTAAKGLVGSILGVTDFITTDKVAIQLLNPVFTSAQQLSMLGKDAGNAFNRPTTIELLVNPAYRIYYGGHEFVDDLIERLKSEHSVYHTYLGVAYALTKPKLIDICESNEEVTETIVKTHTVVPTNIIEELVLEEHRYYQRAGGFMLEYKGKRIFEKSISFLYERDGNSITFRRKKDVEGDVLLTRVKGDVICLV
ncbi:CRISPR-associated protein Cas5 [Fervidibacillus halotolerans]|uniref:CRISPR-associated protein Cas5 n=1 Tax=Fervidibacillus halotolerans TaxID=2980027 RepID=A0A9E8LYM7_9BACI|nr:CRISPR-associated protein Cas5 [Fervidibacillus halotolerans]WAA11989.1 CRISPR-associated protein Cas5 [Fervidibacillus halotolerans]